MDSCDWAALADQLQTEADHWARAYDYDRRDTMDAAGEIADLMRDTPPEEREARLYARLAECLTWSRRQPGRDA